MLGTSPTGEANETVNFLHKRNLLLGLPLMRKLSVGLKERKSAFAEQQLRIVHYELRIGTAGASPCPTL